ncbi:MAG: RNA-binding domain-containing protein [Candidatus Hodarchaeota archaeon]
MTSQLGEQVIISVNLWAKVKPTEDIEKVKQAFLNLCPPATIKVIQNSHQGTVLEGHATGVESISQLAKKFREQRILQAVRNQLLAAVQENSIMFGMQRQAAFANRFHLCDLDDYSAMGPIHVKISADHIRDVIDYISPPTMKGKPQFQKGLKLE